MSRTPAEKISKQCKGCGAPFEVPRSRAQAQFCGTACRNAAGAAAVRKTRLCPCGTELPPKTVSHAMYCSPVCKTAYANKGGRQRQPEAWETRVCRTCEQSFEFRKSNGNVGIFCSNECATKHTSRRQHIVISETDEVLDSSYEAFVWGALRIAKVSVNRFDRAGSIEWSPGHWYGPDFWLPRESVAIECKGLEDDQDQARWAAWRAQRGSLLVLTGDDLLDLSPSRLRTMVREAMTS